MQSSEGLARPGIRKAVEHGFRCGHGGQRQSSQRHETGRNLTDGKALHSDHRAQQENAGRATLRHYSAESHGLVQKESDPLRHRRLAAGVDSRLWEISDMVAMIEEWERESAAQD